MTLRMAGGLNGGFKTSKGEIPIKMKVFEAENTKIDIQIRTKNDEKYISVLEGRGCSIFFVAVKNSINFRMKNFIRKKI